MRALLLLGQLNIRLEEYILGQAHFEQVLEMETDCHSSKVIRSLIEALKRKQGNEAALKLNALAISKKKDKTDLPEVEGARGESSGKPCQICDLKSQDLLDDE